MARGGDWGNQLCLDNARRREISGFVALWRVCREYIATVGGSVGAI